MKLFQDNVLLIIMKLFQENVLLIIMKLFQENVLLILIKLFPRALQSPWAVAIYPTIFSQRIPQFCAETKESCNRGHNVQPNLTPSEKSLCF